MPDTAWAITVAAAAPPIPQRKTMTKTVNSFGPVVMAAFAAAVKIDSFAYMPAQEFGNAFSLFISQNHGAGRDDRVKQGMGSALRVSMGFCLAVSLLIFLSGGRP